MPVERKMPHCEVATVFILGFLVLTGAMPQDDSTEGSLFGLPFLQFKNGGVRVNFGGYHAEAGLGGLLGGSRAGGLLHASAGTPWGANAAAGLGGDLGGDDATAGGGLYARAGLGHGRPEAAAGLGGRLDGSGRTNGPAATGGLYAGATMGGPGGGVAFGDDVSASSGATASASGSDSPRKPGGGGGGGGGGRSSIQIVSRPERKKEHVERAAGQQNEAPSREVSHELGEPGHSAQAGLFGSVFVDPATGDVSKTVDKVKVIDQGYLIPSAPPLPNDVNVVNAPPTVVYKKHVPRWYLRKRFWGGYPRKQVVYVPTSDVNVYPEASASSSASASASAGNQRRLYARAVEDSSTEDVNTNPPPPPPPRNNPQGTFFDDVFRIPMASIGAVNEMLNNAG